MILEKNTPSGNGIRPWIIDTTLRDGEQAPGVVFTAGEKYRIAQLLAEIGVNELEIGYPAISSEERENIRTIAALHLPVRLTSWARASWDDIEHARSCETEAVHISFPVSPLYLQLMQKDYLWVQRQLQELVPKAKKYFNIVSVGAQDATRTPYELLKTFVLDAEACGADRIRIADTVGIATPISVLDLVGRLQSVSPTALEFHAHNDLGMATANAFTALEAGCSAVSVSVTGLGERAGNAALEELAVALLLNNQFQCKIDTTKLAMLCKTVSKASGRPIQDQKPVIGKSVFQHESGIHCAALLKNPLSYQPFLPSEVGRKPHELVIGKHSGSAALKHFYHTRGISLTRDEASRILSLVRRSADEKKRALTAHELDEIYAIRSQKG
ncbi:homocitrate synthase/isopropylmalate synthase family protein [Chlorobium phaeobacteroides]|jgi:homocitrate synthase NifV|uniref:Homocitrate synthase n=1 Tax=Chlorobium phaeobacteroides (strain DSM 266 / SMG 266 / 2430) TaxID=290317 RepID=A1BHQ7_CHLPD|nr:homocitrate synthase [Chlorobium phaeobacteroides]ABL65934.1 homocitrate synthase [Chlorobium phaeobacteroides DSM 266]MBV5327715.1 homocitrate synthase [Chlorobium sp.]